MLGLIAIGVGSGTVLAGVSIYLYNQIVKLESKIKEAESGIEVQLQKRYNLIPDLEALAKQQSDDLKENLEHVLRQMRELTANQREDIPGKARTDYELRDLFSHFLEKAEGGDGYDEIRDTLVETEEKLEMARRYYNALVRDFNIKIEGMPSGVLAALLKFKKKPFFEFQQ